MTTRITHAVKGRLAALCMALLVAGLVAACSGARAAPGASAARAEATPTAQIAVTPGAASGAGPSTSKNDAAPAEEPAAPATGQTPDGNGAAASLPAETRSSEGGGVTIQATPAGTASGDLVFDLALNTHSVELSYDYRALATLTDDQGHVYPAASWDGGNGGHHVTGRLVFGSSPLQSGTGIKWVELQIRDIAGVPLRTFRWNIG